MKYLDLGIGLKSIRVLDAIVKKYGYNLSVSIRTASTALAMNRETFRYHLLLLEREGLISIKRNNTQQLAVSVNKNKTKGLL